MNFGEFFQNDGRPSGCVAVFFLFTKPISRGLDDLSGIGQSYKQPSEKNQQHTTDVFRDNELSAKENRDNKAQFYDQVG